MQKHFYLWNPNFVFDGHHYECWSAMETSTSTSPVICLLTSGIDIHGCQANISGGLPDATRSQFWFMLATSGWIQLRKLEGQCYLWRAQCSLQVSYCSTMTWPYGFQSLRMVTEPTPLWIPREPPALNISTLMVIPKMITGPPLDVIWLTAT